MIPKNSEIIVESVDKSGIKTTIYHTKPNSQTWIQQSLSSEADETIRTKFSAVYEFLLIHQSLDFLPSHVEWIDIENQSVFRFLVQNRMLLEKWLNETNPDDQLFDNLCHQLISVFEFFSENSWLEFGFYPVEIILTENRKLVVTQIGVRTEEPNLTVSIIGEFKSGNKNNRINWVRTYLGLSTLNSNFFLSEIMLLLNDPLINKTALLTFFETQFINKTDEQLFTDFSVIPLLILTLRVSGQTGLNSIRKRIIDRLDLLPESGFTQSQLTEFKIEKVAYLIDVGQFKAGRTIIESMTLAQLSSAPSATVMYYLLLSKSALTNGEVKQALSFTETALAFAAEKQKHILLDIYFHRYRIFSLHLNSVDEAYSELKNAMPVMEELGDPLREGILFNALSLHYYDLYETETAVDYALRAENLLKNYGGWSYLSNTLGLLGIISLRSGQYERAIDYLLQSKTLRTDSGDLPGALRTDSNLAIIFTVLGKFDEAEQKLSNILADRLASGYKPGIAYSYLNLGRVKFYASDSTDAVLFFEKSAACAKEIGNREVELLATAFLLRLTFEPQFEFLLAKADLQRMHKYSVMVLMARMEYRITKNITDGLSDIITEALSFFDEMKSLDGYEQEFLFTVSKAFAFLKQYTRSADYLRLAYHDIQKKAANIHDRELVELFTGRLPLNRKIADDYHSRLDENDDEENTMVQLIYDLTEMQREADSPDFLSLTVSRITEYFPGSECYLFLKNENQKDLDVVRNQNSKTELFLTARTVSHKIIFTNGTERNETAEGELQDKTAGQKYSSLCIPFVSGKTVLGTLYISGSGFLFSDKHRQLLGVIAGIITSKLEREYSTVSQAANETEKNQTVSVSKQQRFHNMSGHSAVMQKVYRLIEAASKSDAPVLITGESGTGKEVAAKAIHSGSSRKSQVFIPLDCGAVSENLLESELFGYKKGSFTGAAEDKVGLFEAATKGVLFLDEITNTTLSFQARLLRVLQEGEIRRIGETIYRKIGTRIISASNLNIEQLIDEQKFRHDLYYRLNVIAVELPALRDRKDDIPLIVTDYLTKKLEKGDKRLLVSKDVMSVLMDYHWPGNIRELINELEKVMALTTENYPIVTDDLSAKLVKGRSLNEPFPVSGSELNLLNRAKELGLRQFVESVEADLIKQEILNQNGKLINIAKSLKLANATLSDKMKKYGLSLDIENP